MAFQQLALFIEKREYVDYSKFSSSSQDWTIGIVAPVKRVKVFTSLAAEFCQFLHGALHRQSLVVVNTVAFVDHNLVCKSSGKDVLICYERIKLDVIYWFFAS